jgi:hypothetical protein
MIPHPEKCSPSQRRCANPIARTKEAFRATIAQSCLKAISWTAAYAAWKGKNDCPPGTIWTIIFLPQATDDGSL